MKMKSSIPLSSIFLRREEILLIMSATLSTVLSRNQRNTSGWVGQICQTISNKSSEDYSWSVSSSVYTTTTASKLPQGGFPFSLVPTSLGKRWRKLPFTSWHHKIQRYSICFSSKSGITQLRSSRSLKSLLFVAVDSLFVLPTTAGFLLLPTFSMISSFSQQATLSWA